MSQCEKAKSELMLQQALMRGQSHFAQSSAHVAQSPSHRTASPHLFGGPVPGMVQGVALGLPAMQVCLHTFPYPPLPYPCLMSGAGPALTPPVPAVDACTACSMANQLDEVHRVEPWSGMLQPCSLR